jgi:polyhydroxyalkanoate synthesis regulator phasin
MDFFDSLRKALLAGFGAQDKVKDFIDELVEKGEISESQGAKLTKEWTEKAQKGSKDFNKTLSDALAKALERMNIPTKDELAKIRKDLKTLSSRVKKVEESKGG